MLETLGAITGAAAVATVSEGYVLIAVAATLCSCYLIGLDSCCIGLCTGSCLKTWIGSTFLIGDVST